jgi:hypothetical protein
VGVKVVAVGTDISRRQRLEYGMSLLFLAIGVAIGVIAYKEVEKFERQYRCVPWGASAVAWGIICFLFGLIGALVLYCAEQSTKKKVASAATWAPDPYLQAQWAPPPAPWTPPMAPGPAPQAPPPAPPAPSVGGGDFLPRR